VDPGPGGRRTRVPLLVLSLVTLFGGSSCGGFSSPRDSAGEPKKRQVTVMGTFGELKVFDESSERAEEVFDRALAELGRIEAISTSYSDSSEVSALGRRAGGTPLRVGPDLDRMLTIGLQVAVASDGAFDPTTGPLVEAWGFHGEPALPTPEAVAAAVTLVSHEDLVPLEGSFPIESGGGRVSRAWRLSRRGMAIDLGALAKGYAVDRAMAIVEETCGNGLVNLGGDLAVRGSKPGGLPWVIGVQDPRDPSRLFVKLHLPGGRAVATSGDYQRYFEVDGVRYHHLLDPRTGHPARKARSATVIAPTCARADAWATAVFVLGPEAGLRALEDRPALEGVIVTVDEEGELVFHESSGFAAYRAD
jgi:thiamine biosynthesis lipoprotein